MTANRPRVSLDAFPVRATVSSRPESVAELIAALARALALPEGTSLFAPSMGWSSRGDARGELAGGLRLVGTKKAARGKSEALLASHAAFDAEGAIACWSSDLDVDVPGHPLELHVRDASGATIALPEAARERALALGLADAKTRGRAQRAARPILVADAPLWAVDLSPDGARCASVDQAERLSLWDARTGERLATRSIAAARRVVHAVAHAHDGARIVSGARPLHVVDGTTLATLVELAIAKGGEARHAVWSPDDARIAAAIGGLRTGNVVVWDAASGERIAAFDHPNPWRVAFAPDGSHLVAGGYGPCMRFEVGGVARSGSSEVKAPHALAWLGTAWAASTDGGVVLLDRDLERAGELAIPRVGRGPRLAVDAACRTLVTGTWTGAEIAIVDVATRAVRARTALPVVDGVVPSLQGVAVSRDGSTIAATAGRAIAIVDPDGALRIAPRAGGAP